MNRYLGSSQIAFYCDFFILEKVRILNSCDLAKVRPHSKSAKKSVLRKKWFLYKGCMVCVDWLRGAPSPNQSAAWVECQKIFLSISDEI